MKSKRFKYVVALIAIMPAQFLMLQNAYSVESFPITFNSIDVDKFTFPQNSEAPRADFPSVVAVFPPCSTATKTDCIASVEFQNLAGKWIKGKFAQIMPYKLNTVNKGDYSESVTEESNDQISVKEDSARNIPALSRSGFWTFPGLKNSGGDKFLVDFTAVGEMSNNKDPLAADSTAIWRRIQMVRIAPMTPLLLKMSDVKSKDPKISPLVPLVEHMEKMTKHTAGFETNLLEIQPFV